MTQHHATTNTSTSMENQIVPILMNNGREGMKHLIIYQLLTKGVPTLLHHAGNMVKNLYRHRMKRHIDHISTMSVRKKTSSVVLQRNYEKDNDMNVIFDAVLSHVSELPQTKYVKRTTTGVFIMASTDEIEVSPCIYVKKLDEHAEGDKIVKLTVEVYSYTYDLTTLRKYLEEVEDRYKMAMSNQLGKNVYYFDELPVSLPMTIHKKLDYTKAPPRLVFTKYPLHTNKSLKNIYGDAVKVVRKRVEFFLHNKRWYEEKGVPYTLGLLLHGVPGAGKTSCIKSISKDTNRHVLNIRLSEHTTVSQLNTLFYSSQVQVTYNGSNKFYDIPIDKRIIVLEDVDCLSDVVLSREDTPSTNEAARNPEADNMPQYVAKMGGEGEKLTLSILLNILDGVLEQPGRILIMTSNHPEKLDRALIRPGRIDVIVNFDYCKRHEVVEIIEAFTGVKVSTDMYAKILESIFTPAEVTRIIFENIDSIDDIIENLSKKECEQVLLPTVEDNPSNTECVECTETNNDSCTTSTSVSVRSTDTGDYSGGSDSSYTSQEEVVIQKTGVSGAATAAGPSNVVIAPVEHKAYWWGNLSYMEEPETISLDSFYDMSSNISR